MKEEKRKGTNGINVGVAKGNRYTRTRGSATHATNTAVNFVSDGMDTGRAAHNVLSEKLNSTNFEEFIAPTLLHQTGCIQHRHDIAVYWLNRSIS